MSPQKYKVHPHTTQTGT